MQLGTNMKVLKCSNWMKGVHAGKRVDYLGSHHAYIGQQMRAASTATPTANDQSAADEVEGSLQSNSQESTSSRPRDTVLDNFPLCSPPLRRSAYGAVEALAEKIPGSNNGVLALVSIICGTFLRFVSDTKVYNQERLRSVLNDKRYKDRPLITVANHISTLDDPVLFGILPFSTVFNRVRMRRILGARELCFSSKIVSFICGSGRVIPVARGDGIYQPAIDLAVKHLNDSGWVHIFPEGFVNQDMKTIKMFRWGISRMILDCKRAPVVVPMYHEGLDEAMPLEPPQAVPKPGKKIRIFIGEPIDLEEHRLFTRPPTLLTAAANVHVYGGEPTTAQQIIAQQVKTDEELEDAKKKLTDVVRVKRSQQNQSLLTRILRFFLGGTETYIAAKIHNTRSNPTPDVHKERENLLKNFKRANNYSQYTMITPREHSAQPIEPAMNRGKCPPPPPLDTERDQRVALAVFLQRKLVALREDSRRILESETK